MTRAVQPSLRTRPQPNSHDASIGLRRCFLRKEAANHRGQERPRDALNPSSSLARRSTPPGLRAALTPSAPSPHQEGSSAALRARPRWDRRIGPASGEAIQVSSSDGVEELIVHRGLTNLPWTIAPSRHLFSRSPASTKAPRPGPSHGIVRCSARRWAMPYDDRNQWHSGGGEFKTAPRCASATENRERAERAGTS